MCGRQTDGIARMSKPRLIEERVEEYEREDCKRGVAYGVLIQRRHHGQDILSSHYLFRYGNTTGFMVFCLA